MNTAVELKCNASPLVDEQGHSVSESGTITVAGGKATFAYVSETPAYANIAITSAMDFLGKDFILTFTGIQHNNYLITPYMFVAMKGATGYVFIMSGLTIILYYILDGVPTSWASWEYNDMEQEFFVTAPRNVTLSRTSKSWALAIEGKTTNKIVDMMEGSDLDSLEGGNLQLGVISEIGGPKDFSLILDNFKFEIDGGGTTVNYKVGNISTNNNGIFYCIQDHSSSADKEPGVGANWRTYWIGYPALHSDLTDLQGGDSTSNEYYHLTEAEHDKVISRTEIATEESLGVVQIGDGLLIDTTTGVLSIDILYLGEWGI